MTTILLTGIPHSNKTAITNYLQQAVPGLATFSFGGRYEQRARDLYQTPPDGVPDVKPSLQRAIRDAVMDDLETKVAQDTSDHRLITTTSTHYLLDGSIPEVVFSASYFDRLVNTAQPDFIVTLVDTGYSQAQRLQSTDYPTDVNLVNDWIGWEITHVSELARHTKSRRLVIPVDQAALTLHKLLSQDKHDNPIAYIGHPISDLVKEPEQLRTRKDDDEQFYSKLKASQRQALQDIKAFKQGLQAHLTTIGPLEMDNITDAREMKITVNRDYTFTEVADLMIAYYPDHNRDYLSDGVPNEMRNTAEMGKPTILIAEQEAIRKKNTVFGAKPTLVFDSIEEFYKALTEPNIFGNLLVHNRKSSMNEERTTSLLEQLAGKEGPRFKELVGQH